MLLAIAFASTVSSNTLKPAKKESPLFRIRTRQAIKEKIGNMMRRFIGERVFFLPFQWIKNKVNFQLYIKTFYYTCIYQTCMYKTNDCITCWSPPSCD